MNSTDRAVIGSGPTAIRVYFDKQTAQIRYGTLIVDLNADAAELVRQVAENSPTDIKANSEDRSRITLSLICSFLNDLADHGVPTDAWGADWSNQCARTSAMAPTEGQ